MAILAHEHLQQALQEGILRLGRHGGVRAFSIDVGIERLVHEATGETKIVSGEGFVLTPEDRYLWGFSDNFFLAPHYMGEVRTRSSYARLGVCVDSAVSHDDFVGKVSQGRSFTPLCRLRTVGTSVKIRPGELVGQLFLRTSLQHCSVAEMKALMEQDELVVYDQERKLSQDEVLFREGLELNMHDVIRVYQGTILDPQRQPDDHDFTVVNVSDFPQGYYLPQGSFFLSSSVQRVATSNRFVSYVTEHIDAGVSEQDFFPLRTHPNAPYHTFGMHALRQITFENEVTAAEGIFLFPHVKQAELLVIPLVGPSDYKHPSRYHGQNGPTLARLGS